MTKIGALVTALAVTFALGAAHADVITGGNVHVSFSGSMSPRTLPRTRSQPIALSVAGSVDPIGDRRPPALLRFVVAVNRHARLSTRGLPVCRRGSVATLTSAQAISRCRDALVGTGHFTAHIDIPEQAPFPSAGRALVFNSRLHGHPALLAHVYGRNPLPTVEVLPLVIGHEKAGVFGLTLSAKMPVVGNEWGYVTGFDLRLKRTYRFQGRSRSLLSASCAAPSGIVTAPFEVARGTFYLSGGQTRSRVLSGACHVRPEKRAPRAGSPRRYNLTRTNRGHAAAATRFSSGTTFASSP